MTYDRSREDYDPEIEDLRAEDRARKMHQARLRYHPDCRDPDHPGCELCEEDEDDAES